MASIVLENQSSFDGSTLYCIHTKKLSCLRSGVEFDMNDIFYEFKYLQPLLRPLNFQCECGIRHIKVSWVNTSQISCLFIFISMCPRSE